MTNECKAVTQSGPQELDAGRQSPANGGLQGILVRFERPFTDAGTFASSYDENSLGGGPEFSLVRIPAGCDRSTAQFGRVEARKPIGAADEFQRNGDHF